MGLFKSNALLAAVLSLNFFSLGAIPPLAGFFAKLLTLNTVLIQGFFIVALIIIITSIISLANYLQMVKSFIIDLPQYNSIIYLNPQTSFTITLLTLFLLVYMNLIILFI